MRAGGPARPWYSCPHEEPATVLTDDDGVLEVALVDVLPGAEEAFAQAYRQGRELVSGTPGFRSLRMTQGVETPTRFVLLVEWDSVEAHQGFRDSDRFPQWRGHIGPHLAGPPHVEHFRDV